MGGDVQNIPSLGFAALAQELPPIDWVLAHLTGTWVAAGEMINCPLPGHDDSTPSFNLWAEDENGVPQRYGCFGCGRGGDVVGLISEIEGLSDQAALVRAIKLGEQEAADQYERKRTPKPKKEPVRPHAETYKMIKDAMGHREYDVLYRFMESKNMLGEAIHDYATEEWGWAAIGNEVVFVHRALGNETTGIKYRDPRKTTGSKGRRNEDGSHFPALYGSWRDKGRHHVLLCEGETDTVWGAFCLRNEEDWDVLGLPSGAGQRVDQEWLELLKDREVTLAFDADAPDSRGHRPGPEAALKWCAERPGTLVARLPEGEDLLSCNIPVKELLMRASVPMRHNGMITVAEGVFAKHTQDGDIPVADFSFAPERELITEEGPAWEGKISGDRRTVLLRAADLVSGSAMTKWCNRHGRSWTGGSGPSVQGVFNFLTASSSFLPLEAATTKAGKIGRSFVGPGFSIGPDRVRYIAPAFGDAKLETKINMEPGIWDPRAILALERLNDPAIMAAILGWIMATMIRGERAPAPPLFVSGESGAGKTNLLSTVLGAVGFGTETNLTTTTPFGVDCMVSSCVGFPVWFDEYRGGARVDSMERLRQLLRDAYYGQPSMKGGMKTQVTELSEVTTWAGIVVSGEMSSGETSHRDRIVMLDLDPASRNKAAYKWLQDKRRTAGLGRSILEFLAARPDILFKIEPRGDSDAPDRFRDTMGFVATGWEAWKHFRWDMGLQDTVVAEPDYSYMSKGRKESEDPWLVAIKHCEGVRTKDGLEIVTQEGNDLVLIPSEIIVEARRVGIELPARANELIAWLKNRYVVEDTRVFSRRAKRVKGMKLD